jgi:hypothetical protein
MTTVLIDNATVSSVQRALGKAKTRNMALLDIEHAALDRFVEAIIFSNKVIVPDNYKEEFTPARKKLLDNFGVEFLKIGQSIDESLGETAKSLIAPWSRSLSVDRVQDADRWHSREVLLAASKKRKRRIPPNGFRDGRANRHGQIAVLLDDPILVPPRDCPA